MNTTFPTRLFAVAQVGNLPFRRLAVGRARTGRGGGLPIRDTADCQSAPQRDDSKREIFFRLNPFRNGRAGGTIAALSAVAGGVKNGVLPFTLLLAIPFASPAQTNPPVSSSGRYLFIVDTSAAMRRYAPAVEKTVANLLLSSMHAQLRRGDTVGLWTFNEELHAGRLPLQQWSPEGEQLVARNIIEFLKKQRYEKTSRLDMVWPVLQRVVKESDKLTVLLISDGDEKITGTPIDREINEFFRSRFKTQQRARMPFVVVLRASRGQFVGATLNVAPWPVEFPAFPPEPKIVEAPPPPPPVEKKPRAKVPPLIVIGKKPEPPSAPAPPTPLPDQKPAPPESAAPVTTAQPSVQPPPAPVTPPTVPVTESKPPPVELPKPTPTEIAPAPTTPAPQPKLELSPLPPTPQAKTVVETKSPVSPPVTPTPPKIESPKSEPASVVSTPSPKPTAPPPPAPTELAESPAPPTTTVEPKPVAPPAKSVAIPPEPTPPTDRTAPMATNPPVQVATAVATDKPLKLVIISVAGLVLLALAGLIFFLVQRRTHAEHASLITRSMDQDRK